MQDALLNHINKFTPLTGDEEDIILACTSVQQLKKKEFLLKKGQVCNTYNFIAEGCLRCFSTDDEDNETILQFAIENWWMTDYSSFNTRKPTHLNIQAVENAVVVKIPYEVLETLLEKVPKLERYFRIITQRALDASHRRIEYVYTKSGEERYRYFSKSFPQFVQRIPQYMLASYLGFTPEFLSKIRAKKI